MLVDHADRMNNFSRELKKKIKKLLMFFDADRTSMLFKKNTRIRDES